MVSNNKHYYNNDWCYNSCNWAKENANNYQDKQSFVRH